jgi:hypothetical protein
VLPARWTKMALPARPPLDSSAKGSENGVPASCCMFCCESRDAAPVGNEATHRLRKQNFRSDLP